MTSNALFEAAGTPEIPLWPDGVPGRIDDGTSEETTCNGGIMRVKTIHDPGIYAFPADPAVNTGTAVVICPGGGYSIVAIEHEGFDVARWFNTQGISAFVLKYRLSPYRHPIPLMDAQQAMRIVRQRAWEWGVNPDRIGVMGFSAGGHLASTVQTHGDRPVTTAGPLGNVSCRPAFAILGYPVISLLDPINTHTGSRNNLVGPDVSEDLLRELSAELQVNAATPPAFCFHAQNDGGVKPANSLTLAEALTKAGIAAEVFLMETGGHGFGLRLTDWTRPCIEWLHRQGF